MGGRVLRAVRIIDDDSFSNADAIEGCSLGRLEMTMDEDGTPATETAGRSGVAERAIAGEREARRRHIAISGVPPYCRVRRNTSCLRR
jgi:hypothetical protein